jgi:hypothetical protein
MHAELTRTISDSRPAETGETNFPPRETIVESLNAG